MDWKTYLVDPKAELCPMTMNRGYGFSGYGDGFGYGIGFGDKYGDRKGKCEGKSSTYWGD